MPLGHHRAGELAPPGRESGRRAGQQALAQRSRGLRESDRPRRGRSACDRRACRRTCGRRRARASPLATRGRACRRRGARAPVPIPGRKLASSTNDLLSCSTSANERDAVLALRARATSRGPAVGIDAQRGQRVARLVSGRAGHRPCRQCLVAGEDLLDDRVRAAGVTSAAARDTRPGRRDRRRGRRASRRRLPARAVRTRARASRGTRPRPRPAPRRVGRRRRSGGSAGLPSGQSTSNHPGWCVASAACQRAFSAVAA